jgi:hypothetical protein
MTMTQSTSRFGFETTRDMQQWINSTTFAGPCCVVDHWTYGRILVTPTERTYRLAGVAHTFVAKDWKTIN